MISHSQITWTEQDPYKELWYLKRNKVAQKLNYIPNGYYYYFYYYGCDYCHLYFAWEFKPSDTA